MITFTETDLKTLLLTILSGLATEKSFTLNNLRPVFILKSRTIYETLLHSSISYKFLVNINMKNIVFT